MTQVQCFVRRSRLVGVAALSLCGLSPVAFVSEAAMTFQSSRDHPLVQPYPGSTLTRRDDDGFTEYKVVTGLDGQGKTDDTIILTAKVPGDLTRISYENPKDKSALEILANYREGLEKAGFKILFQCASAECASGGASSRWGRVTGMRYVSNDMHFVSARRDSDLGTAVVSVSVMRLRHSVDVLVGKPMQSGLVTISDAALKSGLMAEGRVVLDGILFDHDKATIKAESKAALDVIAAFLAGNPSLAVFIVGHTDSAGGLEHNLGLSQKRAQAVVDRLVQEYKVAPARLSAHGVGPLSPEKANATDAGKARNRRVEMVAR